MTAEHLEELLTLLNAPCEGRADAEFQLKQLGPSLARTVLEQQAEIARLTAEVETLTTCGIIEVAVRNPSVNDYILHWETRAEKAEAALSESQALLATWPEVAATEVEAWGMPSGSAPAAIRALTPAHAAAALAARDKATREQVLRDDAMVACQIEIDRGDRSGQPKYAAGARACRDAILAKIKEADHG